jgi:hypothetical protein
MIMMGAIISNLVYIVYPDNQHSNVTLHWGSRLLETATLEVEIELIQLDRGKFGDAAQELKSAQWGTRLV